MTQVNNSSGWCIMKIFCPYCSQKVEIPESPRIQHDLRCQVCGNFFCSAGGLVFRYGIPLDSPDAEKAKCGCPYCGQHYDLSFRPMNDLLGCVECLNVFMLSADGLPSFAEPESDTISHSTVPLPKQSSQISEPQKNSDSASSGRISSSGLIIPPWQRRVLCPELADPDFDRETEEKNRKPKLKLKLRK